MKRVLTIIFAALAVVSCIKNDLPYPTVVPGISSVDVDGAKSVDIDQASMKVLVNLEEEVDITSVRVTGMTFSEEMTVAKESMVGVHDLSTPKKFTLTTYQDYEWTLAAQQDIERYFRVAGQIGSTYFDDVNHRAIAYVSKRAHLNAIVVTALKLGPKGISTYSKSISELRDFRNGAEVTVTAHGRQETWRLFVEQSEAMVEFSGIYPWTGAAWFAATGLAGEDNGFRYSEKGSDSWTVLRGSDITSDGGSFVAKADGLKPLTTYVCQAFSGSYETGVEEFTTDAAPQIPNNGFEVYSKCESKNYYSFFDPQSALWPDKWWDSGNVGSTTVGESYSICNPDTVEKKVGETSSRMDSRYVVIKFAAGNMFSGEFAGLVGIQGGKVNFGRPFTTRPQKLRFWLKYNSGQITHVGGYPDGHPVEVGQNDACQVFIAVGDWDYRKFGGTPESPVQVNTTDRSTFFNPDSDAVIGYGSYETNETTDGWIQVEIPLEYKSYSRVPTHIIISCAASKLGDYFTGSSSSTLWVDEMELIY